MKFKQMEGCTIGYYLEVDGEEFYELPEEKKNEIINYLLVKLKENYKNNGIGIRDILETFQYEDSKCEGPCDQCGDYVNTLTWDI